MINIKITMIGDKTYNITNRADNIKDFFKNVIAPYGTTLAFVEIIPGIWINTSNILSMRELGEDEISEIMKRNSEDIEKDVDSVEEESKEIEESD